jgi:hypothetical protein
VGRLRLISLVHVSRTVVGLRAHRVADVQMDVVLIPILLLLPLLESHLSLMANVHLTTGHACVTGLLDLQLRLLGTGVARIVKLILDGENLTFRRLAPGQTDRA